MTKYLTDSTLEFERHNDSELKEKIKQKWEVIDGEYASSLCGNVNVNYVDGKANLSENFFASGTPSFMQMSSALALYRTISLFECGLNSSVVDFYKSNWQVNLKHKETYIELALGEHKGAFKIFTPFMSAKSINEKYKADVEELLTLLASPTMTINYDGTVAGTYA